MYPSQSPARRPRPQCDGSAGRATKYAQQDGVSPKGPRPGPTTLITSEGGGGTLMPGRCLACARARESGGRSGPDWRPSPQLDMVLRGWKLSAWAGPPARVGDVPVHRYRGLDGTAGRLGCEGYGELLSRHHRVSRVAWSAHGGVEVDTAGDAFFVAFSTASDALAAAREAQVALSELGLRVRMGVHTGEVTVSETGYVGFEVHRAARIAAAAHGGQVVLSSATAALVAPDGLLDLGEHRFRTLPSRSRSSSSGRRGFRRSSRFRTRTCRGRRARSSVGTASWLRCSPGSRRALAWSR